MVEYIIKKGKHSCNKPLLESMRVIDGQKTMEGQFMFTSSCWYQTAIYGTHINKLTGFGVDLLGQNSLRLGWRPAPETNKFEIYAYVHLDGKYVRSARLKDDLIAVVGLDVEKFSISPLTVEPSTLLGRTFCLRTPQENIASFVVGFNQVDRHFPANVGYGFKYWFYFGGVPTAMQNMSIFVDTWQL